MNREALDIDNFRDVGGWPTANGMSIATGVVYRSAVPTKLSLADALRLKSAGVPWLGNLYMPGRVKERTQWAECGHRQLFGPGCFCRVHYVNGTAALAEEVGRLWSGRKWRVREPLVYAAGALALGYALGRCADDPIGDTDPWGGEVPRRAEGFKIERLYVSSRVGETVHLIREWFDVPTQTVAAHTRGAVLAEVIDSDRRDLLENVSVA